MIKQFFKNLAEWVFICVALFVLGGLFLALPTVFLTNKFQAWGLLYPVSILVIIIIYSSYSDAYHAVGETGGKE